MRGKFIVFEGLDGSGKTTVAQAYLSSLVEKGEISTYVKIPNYNNESGIKLKKMLTGEEIFEPTLFTALVIHNTIVESKHIKRLLNAGINVVADRYIFSDCVYRPIRERNKTTVNSIKEILKEVNYGIDLIAPDVLVIVKAPVDLVFDSVTNREGSTEYFETKERYAEAFYNFGVLETSIEEICKTDFNSELKVIPLNNFIVKPVRPVLSNLVKTLQDKIQ